MFVLRSVLVTAGAAALLVSGLGATAGARNFDNARPDVHIVSAPEPDEKTTKALIAQAQARAKSAAARADAAAGYARSGVSTARDKAYAERIADEVAASAASAGTAATAAASATTTKAAANAAYKAAQRAADAADHASLNAPDYDAADEITNDPAAARAASRAADMTAEPDNVKRANNAAKAEDEAVAVSNKFFGAPEKTTIPLIKS